MQKQGDDSFFVVDRYDEAVDDEVVLDHSSCGVIVVGTCADPTGEPLTRRGMSREPIDGQDQV